MSTDSLHVDGDLASEDLIEINFSFFEVDVFIKSIVDIIDSLETKTNVYWIDEYFNYWRNIKKELNNLSDNLKNDLNKVRKAIEAYEEEAEKQKE